MTARHRSTDGVSIGIRAGIAAYAIWGLLTIYWKELHAYDAFELIAWRIVCATIVMAGVVTVRRRWGALRAAAADRAIVARLALAALLLTANWTAYVYAVVHDHVLETALGYFMAPLGTMALGIWVFDERPTRLQRIAVGCAVVAVIALTISYGEPPYLALVIALSWSIYGLLKRQVPLSGVESLAGETFLLAIPAAAFVIVCAGRADSIPSIATGGDWVLVLLTGVVTALPLSLFAIAAQRVPFTILGPLQYLVPTINFLLGWLAYNEDMPVDRLVGFGFVWVALVLVAVDRWLDRTDADPVDEAVAVPTAGQ